MKPGEIIAGKTYQVGPLPSSFEVMKISEGMVTAEESENRNILFMSLEIFAGMAKWERWT